jgi:hypothetical protein
VKRICLVGAAIAALLAIGVTTAVASTTTTTTKLTCGLKLATQVPDGAISVTQVAAQGTQFGKAACGGRVGLGVESNSFDQDAAGSQTGTYQEYFNAGTFYGKYTMAPNTSGQPPTTTSFTAASYTGTVTIKNGTGSYRKATGTGTLNCSTTDATHFTCTEKLKLILPKAS